MTMKKDYLILLICVFTGMVALTGCDSKEVVTLAVETEALAKTVPATTGAYTINDATYDRKANEVSLSIVSEPLYPEAIGEKAIAQADARLGSDLLLRTSELTKLLVAMVNAQATLHVSFGYPKAPAVMMTYTPAELKALYDASQLTSAEFAEQSMAVNLKTLTQACPLPFMEGMMELKNASLVDTVIIYEMTVPAKTDGDKQIDYSRIAADQATVIADMLKYITAAYSTPNLGWQALIKEAWELEYTLRIVVKDPASSRSFTCDFPPRSSLYWIINPK